jgi:hypothetical protein
MNVPAGKACVSPFLRHKLHQGTGRTRLPLFFVLIVDARGRIFEHKIGSPGVSWASPVSALFQEGQFRPKNCRDSVLVLYGIYLAILRFPRQPRSVGD